MEINVITDKLTYWENKKYDKISITVNGSCKDSLLTFGMIMEHDKQIFECAGIIPSHPDEASSYCAELGGIQCTLKIIHVYKQKETHQ